MSSGGGPAEAVGGPEPGAVPDAVSPVAVVVSGAGARGAYEAGALSVILPALGDRRPQFYVGASAGAINSLGFAALSHLEPAAAGEHVLDLWRGISQGHVFRPLGTTLLRAAARMALRGGGRRHRPVAVLDTGPLLATLGGVLNWDQLHLNLRHGRVAACGVVATAKRTHRSIVFLEARPEVAVPAHDLIRDIEFIPTRLAPAHVAGSSAIPAVFPAVSIDTPGTGPDWYVDGGVRLNTPIKPALLLGARRVVVVATVPASLPAEAGDRQGDPPGVASGLIDILRAVTVDPMVEELRGLVAANRRSGPHPHPQPDLCHPGTVEYVFAGPHRPDELGRLAMQVLRKQGRRSPLARFASTSPDLCELASHILFEPDFIEGAIELGRQDARRQLRDGAVVWKCCELPEAS